MLREKKNELVNKGIPNREAYKQVDEQIERGIFNFDFLKDSNIHTQRSFFEIYKKKKKK